MAEVQHEALRILIKSGKLIPFVGAGLSMNLGLPSFSKLIDIIAEELGYDPEVYKLNGNHLQLAEYYVATKGKIGPLRSIMDRSFNPSDDSIKSSIVHTALAKMKLPIIYTTNYDRIIERTFELMNLPVYTIANIDDIAMAPPDATQVVKFHGTFSDDASLVITESSYFDRLEFESAIDIKLRADMLGKSLLFLGYSLEDVNIRYMLYKLHKLRQQVKSNTNNRLPSAYLTTFGSGEVQKTLLAQWNVSIIELDPVNKKESIETFLEALV
ncbi:MAG TPA: SIR2 family protein [Chitinophagaceae bacterium]|nr:SIR2 family protein [Chitinophagaceae bacterium]